MKTIIKTICIMCAIIMFTFACREHKKSSTEALFRDRDTMMFDSIHFDTLHIEKDSADF